MRHQCLSLGLPGWTVVWCPHEVFLGYGGCLDSVEGLVHRRFCLVARGSVVQLQSGCLAPREHLVATSATADLVTLLRQQVQQTWQLVATAVSLLLRRVGATGVLLRVVLTSFDAARLPALLLTGVLSLLRRALLLLPLLLGILAQQLSNHHVTLLVGYVEGREAVLESEENIKKLRNESVAMKHK